MNRMAFVLAVLVCTLLTACGDDTQGDPNPTPPEENLTEYCQGVKSWAAAWVALEDEVLVLTNQNRLAGANCRTEGNFPPAPALKFNSKLRCSARNQSLDMAVRDFFDHTNPDGETPFDRIDKTGYVWQAAGENIAAGQTSADEVVTGWMNSDGHCRNIMDDTFTELGVGYFYKTGADTYKHYWTQNFGKPQ